MLEFLPDAFGADWETFTSGCRCEFSVRFSLLLRSRAAGQGARYRAWLDGLSYCALAY